MTLPVLKEFTPYSRFQPFFPCSRLCACGILFEQNKLEWLVRLGCTIIALVMLGHPSLRVIGNSNVVVVSVEA